jgi:hypothetical protein
MLKAIESQAFAGLEGTIALASLAPPAERKTNVTLAARISGQ